MVYTVDGISGVGGTFLPFGGGGNGFLGMGGGQGDYLGSTPAFDSITPQNAFTAKNLEIHVSSNSLNSSTTFHSKLNGLTANLTISIASNTTGILEDTSHSDSIAAGNTYDGLWDTTAAGSGSGTAYEVSATFDSASGASAGVLLGSSSSASGIVVNVSTTAFFGIASVQNTTEAAAQYKVEAAFSWKSMAIYVGANSITASSTYSSRVNGGAGTQTVTIAKSTTGLSQDTTHTDSLAAGNTVDTTLVVGSMGTSLTVEMIFSEFIGPAANKATYPVVAGDNSSAIAASYDLPYGGSLSHTGTGADKMHKIRGPSVVADNGFANVTTLTTNLTVTTRKNGANGNITMSLTGTGTFEDTTHVDLYAAGDLVNWQAGSSGNVNINTLALNFTSVSNPADTLTLSESVTATLTKSGKGATVVDTLTLGDATTLVHGWARQPSDTLTFGDAIQRIQGSTRTAADTLVFADLVQAYALKGRVIQDGLVLSSAATRTSSVFRTSLDNLILSDLQQRSFAATRTIADFLVLPAPSQQFIGPYAVNPAVGSSDSGTETRCTFLVKGLYWAFYIKNVSANNDIYFSTSSDGITWSAATAVGINSINAPVSWGAWYDYTQDILHIVSSASGATNWTYQSFVPKSDGTLTASTSAVTTNTLHGTVYDMSVWSNDSHNIWVTLVTFSGVTNTYHMEVYFYNGASWSNVDDVDTGFAAPNQAYGQVLPCTSGMVHVYGDISGGNKVSIKRTANNGASWSGPVSSANNYKFVPIAAATIGDVLHVGAPTGGGALDYFNYTFGNAAVANEQTLIASTHISLSAVSIIPAANTIFVFYLDTTVGFSISYEYSTNGGSTWAGGSGSFGDSGVAGLVSSYAMYRGNVIVLWGTSNSFGVDNGLLMEGDQYDVTAYLNLHQPAVDTLSFSDSTSSIFQGRLRTIADALAFVDAATRSVTFSRSILDTLIFNDFTSRVQGWSRSNTDTIIFSDFAQIVTGASFLRTVMDALVLADFTSRVQGWTRNNSDTLVLQDFVQRIQGYVRSPVDTLVLTDLVIRTSGIARSLADALVLTDALSRVQGWVRSPSDTLVFQDLLSRTASFTRSTADTIVIQDLVQRIQGYGRSLVDTLVFNDLASRVQGWSRSNFDTMVPADSVTRIGTYTRSPVDTLTLADLASTARTWMRSLADTLAVNDLVTRVQGWARAITDTIRLADALSAFQGWNRSLADTLLLTDLSSRTLAASRTNTDTLVLRDLVTDVQGWTRSPVDALTLQDFVQQSQGWSRSLADALVLNDSLLRSQGWVRSLGDTLVFQDFVSATLVAGLTRFVTDTLVLGDAVTRTASMLRTVIESFQISDRISVVKVVIKTPHGRITKYITLRKRMARHEPEDFDVVTN